MTHKLKKRGGIVCYNTWPRSVAGCQSTPISRRAYQYLGIDINSLSLAGVERVMTSSSLTQCSSRLEVLTLPST